MSIFLSLPSPLFKINKHVQVRIKNIKPDPTLPGMGGRTLGDRREEEEEECGERGRASPVLGGGGVWGEEDVLDDTCVPLFHCGLPGELVLQVEWEILGKPQPRQRSGPTQLQPQHFSPLATLPWDWPQDLAPCEAVSSSPNPAQRSVLLRWVTHLGGRCHEGQHLPE